MCRLRNFPPFCNSMRIESSNMLNMQIPSVKSMSFNIYLYICNRKVMILGGKDSDYLLIHQIKRHGNVLFSVNV